MGTTIQVGGLVKIKEEERYLGESLLAELGLIALLDLLEVKDCLPLGVWLV